MVANIRGFTPNYNFKLINFDTPRWHTHEYANWSQLDAMFLQVGVPGMRGEWQNATLYLAGERVFDVQTADMYRCLVEHVSPSTGTFEAARTQNPGFWVLQTLGVPLYRGDWASGVQYSLGDLVKVDSYKYYLCVVRHVSSITFAADTLFWTFVFDATATINDANQAASDAHDDAVAAHDDAIAAHEDALDAHEDMLAADQDAKDAHDDMLAAAESARLADVSADAALASEQVAAMQAASLKGTSNTTHTISIGSKTFATQPTKQFNVGNYMTIVDTANPTGKMMNGPITAYDFMAVPAVVTVNVTSFVGSGTSSDWQLYISGAQGAKGNDGIASTGIPEAPIDGSIYGRGNSAWQTVVRLGGDIMTGHLSLPVNASPAAAHAIRKDYVDSALSTVDLSTRVAKAGDTMTGQLSLPTTPTPVAANAVRKDYVDGAISGLVIPPATVAATAAEYITGTNNAKMVTPKTAWDAAAATFSLGTGATVTPSMASGIDFTWNPSAASITLGNPTNTKVGQKGVNFITTQAANTAITWGSNWKFAGGVKPVLSTAAGSTDVLSYVCRSATSIMCTFSVDMK
jgi:hypothetical protein